MTEAILRQGIAADNAQLTFTQRINQNKKLNAQSLSMRCRNALCVLDGSALREARLLED